MPFLNTFGAGSAKSLGWSRGLLPGYVGQALYATPGSYSLTVPVGATKMSVVMINAGGSGTASGRDAYNMQFCYGACRWLYGTVAWSGSGGAGGQLRYKNCITVVAGQSIGITVGNACSPTSSVTLAGASVGYDVQNSGGAGGAGSAWYGPYYPDPNTSGWNRSSPYLTGGSGGSAGGYSGAGSAGSQNGGAVYGANTSVFGTSPGGSTTAGGGGYGGSYCGTSVVYGPSSGYNGAVRILFTNARGPTRQFPATNVGNL